MQFQITTLTLSLLAALTTAAPSSLESRQGGYYNSVGYKYSGPGCNSQTLIFADPIFGSGGYCQALDRSGNGTPIVSYLTSSIADGCSVKLYSSADCTGTAYSAPKGGCVTGNAPFVSTFVTCTWAT